MVASLAGVALEELVADADQVKAIMASGAQTFPVLETEEGQFISQTQAIIEYLAYGNDILGKTQFEQA